MNRVMTKARHRKTNGVFAEGYAYDSWGNPVADATGRVPPALRFTWQGREYSHATALYSFRARWYDPSAGRWLSKDPIGLEGGLNLYEAFSDNPVCFRDPEGFELVSTDKRIDEALKTIQDILGKAARGEKKHGKNKPCTAALEALQKLMNRDKVYTPIKIYITTRENKYCESGTVENLGRGAYPIILWNPVLDESVCDASGSKKRPPYIGLAHEIGHAVSYYANDLKIVDPDGTRYDMRNAKGGKQGKEEMAMRFENIVRSAAGLNKRVAY